MKVEVIRKTLKYGHRAYAVGSTLEMSSKDAKVFAAINRVQIAEPVTPVSEIPAAPAPVSLVTRTYDHPGLDAPESDGMELLGGVSAEPATENAPAAESAPAPAAATPEPAKGEQEKGERTYKRRDMKAGK